MVLRRNAKSIFKNGKTSANEMAFFIEATHQLPMVGNAKDLKIGAFIACSDRVKLMLTFIMVNCLLDRNKYK